MTPIRSSSRAETPGRDLFQHRDAPGRVLIKNLSEVGAKIACADGGDADGPGPFGRERAGHAPKAPIWMRHTAVGTPAAEVKEQVRIP